MVQIFISYRRDDTAGYARAIHDELARRFGADKVFIDVDDIAAGQSFADVIRTAVTSSSVVLVLIGKRWHGAGDGSAARIYDSTVFVRMEVAAALASGAPVIPVLLDAAAMPNAAQLPEPLRALASRNAFELRATAFSADMARLVDELQPMLGDMAQRGSNVAAGAEPAAAPAASKPSRGRSVALWGGVATAVAGLAAAWLLWGLPSQQPATPATAVAPAAAVPVTARPDVNGSWHAEVQYDWSDAKVNERFEFSGDAADVSGSATFLGVRRGVLEGRADATGLRFVTRTAEATGSTDATRELVHRYRAQSVDGELRFVMQTEGGASPHEPVSFVARRPLAPR